MPHDLNVGIGGITFGDISKLSQEDAAEFKRLKAERADLLRRFNNSRQKNQRARLLPLILANLPKQRELFGIFEHGKAPPEPEEEECFKFVNVFRLQGSTAPGAPPQVKVLVSSGKISCENADTLEASGHIIEEITEGEVSPPKVEPVIPQNPFYIKNGVKTQITENKDGPGRTLRIEIKESLGFKEIG